MKKILLLACIGIMMMAASGQAMAESKPIQLSLTPDIAVFGRHTEIKGLALSIWGENPQKALAIGFVNGSTGSSAGFSLGLVNYADSYTGVQWALANYTKGSFVGWQSSIVSYTEGAFTGLQSGFFNYAGNLTGLQLGFVNYAAKVTKGVQIGLVNLMPQNRWFTGFPKELAPGMVIVNWRF